MEVGLQSTDFYVASSYIQASFRLVTYKSNSSWANSTNCSLQPRSSDRFQFHETLLNFFEALHALISERAPVHIWGACGVGKSQIGAQVAADRKCEFLDIRAVQLDPVDPRGKGSAEDPPSHWGRHWGIGRE